MSDTYTTKPDFAYITRIEKLGAKLVACGGLTDRLIVGERTLSATINFLGISGDLGAPALAVATDGSNYFAMTKDAIQKLTLVNAPVVTATYPVKTGGHPWMFLTAGGRLIFPLAEGGIRMMTTAGVVVQDLKGVGTASGAVLSGSTLYVFDGHRGKVSAVTVTASSLTWEGAVNAPNCRDILRVAIDGVKLLCLCRNRLVRFDVTTPTAPAFSQDYGNEPAGYTDLVVIGAGKYWVGYGALTGPFTGPYYLGPQRGCWDSATLELHTADRDGAIWGVHNTFPLFGGTTYAATIPIITSALTLAGDAGSAFTYTITASGSLPMVFTLDTTPAWVTSINSQTGVVTGTLPAAGSYSLAITATNAGGVDSETVAVTSNVTLGLAGDLRVNGEVYDMVLEGSLLYIVGGFTQVTDTAGNLARANVACLNLTTYLFTSFNPGATGDVTLVASDATYIYLGGGGMTAIGGTAVTRLGRVSTAGSLDTGWYPAPDDTPAALAFSAGGIFVGGYFDNIGGAARSRIAQVSTLNGTATAWEGQLATGERITYGGVEVLAIAGSILRAAGNFVLVNGAYLDVEGYAEFNISTGITPTMGYSIPGALAMSGEYFSGDFHYLDELNSATPASIDRYAAARMSAGGVPESWDPGLTIYNVTGGLAVDGTAVYLAGNFVTVKGGTSKPYVAKISTASVLDTGFTVTFNAVPIVYRILRYSTNILILAGDWTATVNGSTRPNFVLVNAATGALL